MSKRNIKSHLIQRYFNAYAFYFRECWDHDVEARLSASNVVERIKVFRELAPAANDVANNGHTTTERDLNTATISTTTSTASTTAVAACEEHELQPLINGDPKVVTA